MPMDIKMGGRKLIGTSHRTILMALPIQWVRSVGVEVGDTVQVVIDSAGRLIISKEGLK